MNTAQSQGFTFKVLTTKEAEDEFPGCIDEEITETLSYNEKEENYAILCKAQADDNDGRLFFQISDPSYPGWSTFVVGKGWRNLDDVDNDLHQRLMNASSIEFK